MLRLPLLVLSMLVGSLTLTSCSFPEMTGVLGRLEQLLFDFGRVVEGVPSAYVDVPFGVRIEVPFDKREEITKIASFRLAPGSVEATVVESRGTTDPKTGITPLHIDLKITPHEEGPLLLQARDANNNVIDFFELNVVRATALRSTGVREDGNDLATDAGPIATSTRDLFLHIEPAVGKAMLGGLMWELELKASLPGARGTVRVEGLYVYVNAAQDGPVTLLLEAPSLGLSTEVRFDIGGLNRPQLQRDDPKTPVGASNNR